jgi:hypothetical protein
LNKVPKTKVPKKEQWFNECPSSFSETKSIGKDAPVVVITGTGKFSGTRFAGATGVTENHVAQIVRETLASGGTHQRGQEGSLNVVHGFQFILHCLGSDVSRVFHRDRTAVASLDQIHRTHHVGVLKKSTHTVESH